MRRRLASAGFREVYPVRFDRFAYLAVADENNTGMLRQTVIVWQENGKIRAQTLDSIPDSNWGWRPVEFRLRNGYLIGTIYTQEGNWWRGAAAVYRLQNDGWRRVSVHATDHEVSSIAFAGDRSDDVVCRMRSYDFLALHQTHAGPLLTDESHWRLVGDHYVAGKWVRVHNALDAFDQLINALIHKNGAVQRRFCPSPALRRKVAQIVRASGKDIHAMCPGYEDDSDHVFGFWDSKRNQPTLFVDMEKIAGQWQVKRLAPEEFFVKRRHYPEDF